MLSDCHYKKTQTLFCKLNEFAIPFISVVIYKPYLEHAAGSEISTL